MALHRRGIVNLVYQFSSLGSTNGWGVKLAVIHAVAINPAIDHINFKPFFLRFAKTRHSIALYLLSIKE